MPNLGRYFRTLRHLRMTQLTGQLYVRLRRRLRNPEKMLANVRGDWRMPAVAKPVTICPPVPNHDADGIALGRFHFIGHEVDFASSIDWDAPGQPRLWAYNLHYFDWIWSLLPDESPDWQTARRLTTDWIQNHPPSKAACGWEPYPISLRLINWSLLFGRRHRGRCVDDEVFRTMLMESLARQIRWLELNIETHIQANHLLENLAALACVGSIFEGAAADEVLTAVLPMLERELGEQILADGCHYERSLMYHLRMLWLVEMLAEVGTPDVRAAVEGLPERMCAALACLRHPDGDICQFNDSAQGIYLDGWKPPSVPASGAWDLPSAGYYGWRSSTGDYVVIDAGAVGPDHQPGHAHADYFSFELSLDGQRLITDTGIGSYDAGDSRAYDRSTSAHSTVEVDGQNSAEVWGSFRVGRRVVPEVLEWAPRGEGFVLQAEHAGYAHLPCGAIHRRRFVWAEGELQIEDEIAVRAEVDAISRIHFAPSCRVSIEGECACIEAGGRSYYLHWVGSCSATLETKLCHPTFGAALERKVLVMNHRLTQGRNSWLVRIGRVACES